MLLSRLLLTIMIMFSTSTGTCMPGRYSANSWVSAQWDQPQAQSLSVLSVHMENQCKNVPRIAFLSHTNHTRFKSTTPSYIKPHTLNSPLADMVLFVFSGYGSFDHIARESRDVEISGWLVWFLVAGSIASISPRGMSIDCRSILGRAFGISNRCHHWMLNLTQPHCNRRLWETILLQFSLHRDFRSLINLLDNWFNQLGCILEQAELRPVFWSTSTCFDMTRLKLGSTSDESQWRWRWLFSDVIWGAVIRVWLHR